MICKLRLKEQDGVARRGSPITGGIALAVGTVQDAGKLALRNADGETVPLQARALTHWRDGSVKWVSLDFQTDLEAHGTESFELQEGEAEQPAPLEFEGIVDGEPLPRLSCEPRIVGVELDVGLTGAYGRALSHQCVPCYTCGV